MSEQLTEQQQIRRALLQAAEEEYREALAAVPAALPFSARYRRWERGFLRDPFSAGKSAARLPWQRVLRSAACFLVTLSVVFVSVVMVCPGARAAMIRWVIQEEEDHIVYNFEGSIPDEPLGQWEPTYLPTGYRQGEVVDFDVIKTIYYETDDPAMTITFSYQWIANGQGERLDHEHHTMKEIIVNGRPGQLFQAEDGTNHENMLLWLDEENNRSFLLMAHLPCDTLVEIAKSVSITK